MLLWDFQIKIHTQGSQGLTHSQWGAGRTKPKARFQGTGSTVGSRVAGPWGWGPRGGFTQPHRALWQLAAALLMETEHSPEGADSAAQGWGEFLQPAPCGAASLKGQRCRTLVSWRGTTLRVVCVCVLSWLED